MSETKLRTAMAAVLRAGSVDDVERAVERVAQTLGFQRAAILSLPTMQHASYVMHSAGAPHLELRHIAAESPLAPGGFLDALRAGSAGDPSVPHDDVRGFFVLAPLRERERTLCYFYADSPAPGIDAVQAGADISHVLDIAGLVCANLRLLSERDALLAEVESLATSDSLTSLANRRMFEERIAEELHRSARSRRPFALALFDVDRFGEINSRFGRAAGDEALQHVASTIRARARHVDYIARFGGDEFAMLLVDVDHQTARRVAERILDGLAQARVSFPSTLAASAGVALSYPVDTVETLLERAEAALLDAKRAGSNKARVT